ncbi:unnamed protein product [Didymodactylos carnosus]|nr:unnamed protein product [Didymodactylos carnosus]CAF4273336.1 unnamed protein product [Didymodactylos carnosus]
MKTTMSDENETTYQKPSVELLEAIVRDCQQNEQRLQKLERHTRHERKKAEKLLHETTLTKINHAVKTSDNRRDNINNENRLSTYTSSLRHNNDVNGKNDKKDHRKRTTKKKPTSQQQNFFISLDDDEGEDNINNNNKEHVEQNTKENPLNKRQLLDKVEKLLAGDWTSSEADQMKKSTTTASDSSSNERKHEVNGKNHSIIAQWVDDDKDKTPRNTLNLTTNGDKSNHRHSQKTTTFSFDEQQEEKEQLKNNDNVKLFKSRIPEKTPKNVDDSNRNEPRRNKNESKEIPIEYEKKITPDQVNIKINVYDKDNTSASSVSQIPRSNKNVFGDKRDEKFYERLNNFVRTGKFVNENDQNHIEEDIPQYKTYVSPNRTLPLDNTRYDHQYDSSYNWRSPLTTNDDTKILPTTSSSRQWSRKYDDDPELADLAQRCDSLLRRLQAQRQRASVLDSSYHPIVPLSSYSYPTTTNNNRRYRSSTNCRETDQQPNVRNRSVSPARQSRNRSLSPVKYQHHHNEDLMTLQEALELSRPDFISRSRQRVRRIKLLREERQHNAEFDYERQLLFQSPRPQSHRSCYCCDKIQHKKRPVSAYDQQKQTTNHHKNRPHSTRADRRSNNICYNIPSPTFNRPFQNYQAMKQATKKKYDQLPEVNQRRRQQE